MKIMNFWKFTFVCESKSNRSGFKHECTMFLNNREIWFSKIQYYNRTRERFTYESVIDDCLRDFRTKKIDDAIRDYKNNNNVKRLSKLQKNRIAMDFDGSELWQLIANARDDIASYNWF